MKTHVSRRVCALSVLVAACVLLLTGVLVNTVAADGQPFVVRVEEDWELVLLTPDPETTAPQVTCAFSPVAELDSVYATFELNHRSQPGFAPGGLHLQVWRDETALATRSATTQQVLSTQAETVRWTQTISWYPGLLTFEVVAGDSVTWGSFGDPGQLRTMVLSGLANLNGYDPAVSVANSGVGFASNRVHSLKLKAVRLVTATGEVLEDSTVRSAYPQQ
jgi:hypothetical protein